MKIIIEATPAEVVQLITSLEGEKSDALQVDLSAPKDILCTLIKELNPSQEPSVAIMPVKPTESANTGEK